MSAEKPECFVIAPIGQDKSETRLRSDQILKHVIRPVADECGYKAVRADEIAEPGSITTQVINRILNAPMVIADLTGQNANVFYELAIRHAIRKPYVQIIQKGERIPFDIANIRTVEIDHTNLDSVATAKDEIKRQMQFTTAPNATIESPITVAIDLASLSQSGDPMERQMADVLNGIADIKKMIDAKLNLSPLLFYQQPPSDTAPAGPTAPEALKFFSNIAKGYQGNTVRSGDGIYRARPIKRPRKLPSTPPNES